MLQLATAAAPIVAFPPRSALRAHLTYRLPDDTTLPTYKGALLRGGFGCAYAFRRSGGSLSGRAPARSITPPADHPH